MAYTPRTFTKNVWDDVSETYVLNTQVAETAGEDVDLLWDGWSPGSPAPVPPPFTAAQQEYLESLSGSSASSALIVVDGGAVDLDDTLDDGDLVGYRATATTTFQGVEFAPGSYVFARNEDSALGWDYWTLAVATELVEPPTGPLPASFGTLTQGQSADLAEAVGANPIKWSFTTNKVPSSNIDIAFKDAAGTSIFIVRCGAPVWEFFKTGYAGLGGMSVASGTDGFGAVSFTLEGTTLTAVVIDNTGAPQTRTGTVDSAAMIDRMEIGGGDVTWTATSVIAEVPA